MISIIAILILVLLITLTIKKPLMIIFEIVKMIKDIIDTWKTS